MTHQRKSLAILLAISLLSGGAPVNGAEPESPSLDPYRGEGAEARDARMGWWREARFGMFIHWGVYAVPAGTYRDKRIDGIGEWIMNRGKIPVAEYRAYARRFNPVKYDPSAWASLARRAGMRYMVITSKHHDGFALFDSAASDWDAVDATPYGKDLIAPLAKAARSEGLRFGLYYSQAQDWTHPGGAKSGYKEGESWDEANKGNFDEYLRKIAVPQVREILTQISPDILWWDTPTWMTKERADLLIPLVSMRPGLIHNNRLGGGYKGDTDTPEQHIPATGIPGRDWEVCMTMNDTWGYKSYDQNWKSVEDLIRKLCDIASKGGNFLLNVGPTAEGEIPAPSIERLEAVGAWMRTNGEAIYGTSASPFHLLPWGRCTKKIGTDGATLYLHVFDWPRDRRLAVPGLRGDVRGATLLAGGAPLQVERSGDGVAVIVPAAAPDPVATVIRLEIGGKLDVDPVSLRQGTDGSVTLDAQFAELNNPGYGDHARLEMKGGKPSIGFWTDARVWVQWTFKVTRPGTFRVKMHVAGTGKSEFRWGIGEKLVKGAVEPAGGYDKFAPVELGTVTIDAPGTSTLAIRPIKQGWKAINLRGVTLTPAP